MDKKTNALLLKPIEDSDIPLVEEWIHQKHVLTWYHEPEEWIREMKERKGEFSFLHHFIVREKEIPFAFCQYYDCFHAQEEWYKIPYAGETYSIDYLIGNESYLGKGYGKAIVKALMETIRNHTSAKSIIVQPEKENLPSCRSLEANGFLFDEEKQYYHITLR